MAKLPNNFSGSKFRLKYGDIDFRDIGGDLFCPSLPNLTDADIADCIVDPWDEVRKKRNALLAECDWTQIADAPLTIEEKSAWSSYRQDLRNLPQDYETPESIVWPTPPQ